MRFRNRGRERLRASMRPGRRQARSAVILGRDRSAAGDFLEGIPAFVVIVISVSLFMASAYAAYGNLGRDAELSRLQKDCWRLCRAFRSYERVLGRTAFSHVPESGNIDEAKLSALDLSVLQRDLAAPHRFCITVRDLLANASWSLGPAPPSECRLRAAVFSHVFTTTDEGRHDPGRLEVVLWE